MAGQCEEEFRDRVHEQRGNLCFSMQCKQDFMNKYAG
jgi:hypothetical protein